MRGVLAWRIDLQHVESTRGRFHAEKHLTISSYLDEPLPPTLCFSDTHLAPRPLEWSDDAPEDLLALVQALPDHRILVLGDLTESIGLGAAERAQLESSSRLAPLFRTLAQRQARLVLGNHDTNAIPILERLFGREHVAAGGFEMGRISVRHGHEAAPLRTWVEARVGPLAVPLFERFRRGGPPERLDNDAVLRGIRRDSPFVLFGHTHSAMLEERAANPGCFLRSAQSFLTLAGYEATLFRRD
jgi:predicted phosphodiesterase